MKSKSIIIIGVIMLLVIYLLLNQPIQQPPIQILSFCVLSDIHGNVENTKQLVNKCLEKKVSAFILPGDIVEHYRNDVPDDIELKQVLSVVAGTGLSVFIVPGNHEGKDIYYSTLDKLKFDNIIDMIKTRKFVIGNITLLSLPGYDDKNFMPEDGFLFTSSDIQQLAVLAKASIGKKLLISHQPTKSIRDNGIDVIYSGEHAGSEQIAKAMGDNDIDVLISGHIHEAGGQAETKDGVYIPQNTFSKTIYLNSGSVMPWVYLNGTKYNGLATIIYFNGTEEAYEVIINR